MNANQAQSKGQAANGPQGQTKQQNAKMNAKIMEAVNTKFLGKSRTFYFLTLIQYSRQRTSRLANTL